MVGAEQKPTPVCGAPTRDSLLRAAWQTAQESRVGAEPRRKDYRCEGAGRSFTG